MSRFRFYWINLDDQWPDCNIDLIRLCFHFSLSFLTHSFWKLSPLLQSFCFYYFFSILTLQPIKFLFFLLNMQYFIEYYDDLQNLHTNNLPIVKKQIKLMLEMFISWWWYKVLYHIETIVFVFVFVFHFIISIYPSLLALLFNFFFFLK